jgi:hypothetical protein
MKRIQRRDFEPLGWNEANIGWMVYLVLPGGTDFMACN